MIDLSFLEESSVPVPEGDLKALSEMVKVLKEKRTQISFLKEQLKTLEKEERKMSRENIPDFLLSKNLTSIGLSSGETVHVDKSLSVSLPKKDVLKRRTVLNWIIENGGEGIVDEILSVEDPEEELFSYLQQQAIPFNHNKDIHHSRLKAWFRAKLGIKKGTLQEIEVGDVPTEANLFIYSETKIKGV